MQSDQFERVSVLRGELIGAAKRNKETAFFLAHHVAESDVFLLDGQEVTKEDFILRSNMEHLLPGASTVACSKCRRTTSPSAWHSGCGFVLPSGAECEGIFF